jgi:hypothetical protein
MQKWIRIQLITLMRIRIRIQLLILMRIQIRTLAFNLMQINANPDPQHYCQHHYQKLSRHGQDFFIVSQKSRVVTSLGWTPLNH